MSIAEELERLQRLRENGAISDEEFAAAKAKLLSAQPVQTGLRSGADVEADTRRWAVFIHISQFAGFVVPGAGLALPIILWQLKKTELPGVDAHGKTVTNWIISELIYLVVGFILALLLIGIPILIAVIVVGIVFPIIGAIKANEGELWQYPLSITFVK